ncbi:hypothetical protein LTR50_004224 [Elasticomyces elasticus]|nr:hypothetical protein LTR50_004224 [Elasticomyces elasticus]
MKRKDAPTKTKSMAKKPRPEVPEYHLTPSLKDEDGGIVWPAPKAQMQRARDLILECAAAGEKTLIVPDKDADGLTSGVILYHTLNVLGLPLSLLSVHLLKKGNNIHTEEERYAMQAQDPSYIFILDQGSRKAGPVIDRPHKALIIDHHHATPDSFPAGAEHVTACDSPPVATSSLLTYTLCEPLHESVGERCSWLCIVGTHGDLGNTLKWEPPFPDMKPTFKVYTKKLLNDVVSLVNAPRRTATYDVSSAWSALLSTAVASDPASVLKDKRLLAARQEVNAEVERCTHTAPKFSPDGKIAVFTIHSEAQVHPVIATRWSGHLNSKALEIVCVANTGYLPGKVNFSCRVPRCARNREPPVDIIQSLRSYASLKSEVVDGDGPQSVNRPSLLERLGDDFARGHVQASGGIVNADEFDELLKLMRIGEKSEKKRDDEAVPKKRNKGALDAGQTNTLTKYFGRSSVTKEGAAA